MDNINIIENVKIQKLSDEERRKLRGHGGVVIWLTGLSGSGKSTIAHALEQKLLNNNIHTVVLDGDKIRKGLCSDLGFSPEDRRENIRRIGEVAKLFHDACTVTIVAFISPYREDRQRARRIIGDGHFVEVFLDCPIAVCEKRDAKGLYKRARAGEIKEFTGISAPYEAPKNPEIHLHTDSTAIGPCVEKIIHYMSNKKLITR